MIIPRKAEHRGRTQTAWLDSRHSFSFGEYYDPEQTGFSVLRVINEDRVSGGGGFPSHGHRDMEIVTYVLEGALEHRDNLGNHSVIPAGDVQRMTAGTGIVHSEFNHSRSQPVHFLQIWIVPSKPGLAPGYEQETLERNPPPAGLRLIAAPAAANGALIIHQDARLYLASLDTGGFGALELDEQRRAYLQVARGTVQLGALELGAGDGARISGERRLELKAAAPAEVLLFDLP